MNTSAKQHVTENGQAINKLTGYTIQLQDGREVIVERSNGFVMSGFDLNSHSWWSIDLRNEDAKIINPPEWSQSESDGVDMNSAVTVSDLSIDERKETASVILNRSLHKWTFKRELKSGRRVYKLLIDSEEYETRGKTIRLAVESYIMSYIRNRAEEWRRTLK